MAKAKQTDFTGAFKRMRSRFHGSFEVTIYFGKGLFFMETIPLPPTKKNCERWFEKCIEIKAEIKLGTFIYRDHFPMGNNAAKFAFLTNDQLTLKERLNDYRDEITTTNKDKLATVTVTKYKNIIEKELIGEFGHLYAGELTQVHISRWTKTLKVVKKTLDNKVAPLKFVLNQAIREGVINTNVFNQCSMAAQVKSRYEINAFSQDEQTKILAQSMPDHLRYMLNFWFFTGLRTSEIFGLKWEKWDRKKQMILINEARVDNVQKMQAKTKAGNRQFTLLDRAHDALVSHYDLIESGNVVSINNSQLAGEFVFFNPNTGKPWTYNVFMVLWKRLLKQAEVDYRSARYIRHTFATMMAGLIGDGSLTKVVQMFGHETEETFRKFYNDTSITWVDADWSDVNNYLAV